MTKKRFFKLRQALMAKVIQNGKAEGVECNGYWLNRMPQPKFGATIEMGKYAGQKLTSYEQAWETLKPLRDAFGM